MRRLFLLLSIIPFCVSSQTCETIFPSQYADSIQYCVTDASCHDSCDGSIVINVWPDTATYYFEWNNSNVSTAWDNSRTNLCASSHIITITDANGNLVDNAHINTVEEPTNFSVFEIISNPSCFNYSDGYIDITISGSVPFATSPPYIMNWLDGPTSEDRYSLDSGIYILDIEDANGCTRRDTFELLSPDQVTSFTTGDTLSCIGTCDGESIVVPTSGFSPYTFLWSDGQTGDTAVNLCYGLNTVIITDSSGCLDTNSVFINNPDTLMIDNIIIDSACYQMCDGEISVSISGGSPPYDISWSASGIIFDTLNTTINNLCSDIYSIIYHDANHCVDSMSIHLLERDSFNISSSVTDASCFNSCNGQISVQLLNPNNPPFIYDWSNGDSLNIVTDLCSDSISLELIDNGGCRDTFYFHVDEPNILSFDSMLVTHNLCYGDQDGQILVNIIGGTGNYSYNWSGVNNFSSSYEDIGNLLSGTYSLHVEDQNLCVKDTIITITEPDSLIAVHSVQNASCFGYADGIIDVTIQGGVLPYNISWDIVISDSTNIDSLLSGEYIYYITDSNGCSLSDTAIIDQPDLLVILDTITHVLCYGDNTGSIDLTIDGGTLPYTYQWNNNILTQDIFNVYAGIYSVTVTDINGCSESSTYNINEPSSSIVASIDPTDVICYGDNTGAADLTVNGATSPYTFLWSNAETNEDISNLFAGNYSVLITDDNGCTTTASVDILENSEILTTTNIQDVLCYGDSTGIIELINTVGGISPYTYDFSNGISASTPITIYVDVGQYSVLVTDVNACTENLQFIISEPDSLNATVSTTDITCYGYNDGSAIITPTGGTLPISIDWYGMNENALPPGIHSYTITDNNGCLLSGNVMINEPPVLVTTSTYSESLCHGDNDGSITIIANGGIPPYQYFINGSNMQSTGLFSSLSAGSYSISTIDDNGCSEIEAFNLTEPLPIQAFFNVIDVLCFGESTGYIDLTVNGGSPNPDYIYVWNNNVNTQDIDNLFAGDYSVVITDGNNCSESFDVSVVHPEIISVGYTVYDATCEENNDGSIVTNVIGGVMPYTYLWSNGLYDEDLLNLSKGSYSLQIMDANNCLSEIEVIEIGFEGYDGCIEIPSGFTPNGDGIHDEWAIYGLYNFPDIVVNIYNRWGQQVFYSEGYDVPWDGRRNGTELPIATYYYVIELKDSGKVFNGTVTIKR